MDGQGLQEASEQRLSRRQFVIALSIAAATAGLLALILAARITWLAPLTPAEAPLIQGQGSPVTILAPDRISFASRLQTAQAQAKAAEAVPAVYDPPNAEIARQQLSLATRVLDFLGTLRADPYSSRSDKTAWVTSIPGLTVPADAVSRTVAMDGASYQQVISETLYVLDQSMRDPIRDSDLAAARSQLPSRVSLALSAEQADLVTQWAGSFLIPNSAYDAAETNAERQQARERVGTVYRTFQKGEAVVRAGEVITPEIMEALQEMGYLQPQPQEQEPLAAVLFATFLAVIAALYLRRFEPSLLRQPRVLGLLAFLWLGAAVGAKIVVPGHSLIPYLFPFAAAGMLGAALLDAETGVGLALLVALTVAYISGGTLDLTLFALVGGLVAVLTLRQRDRLTAFVLAGLYVALANAALILIFRLLAHDEDFSNAMRLMLAGIISGLVTGLLALGSQFVLGRLAGLTTALDLIELSRPTHPLLQKLLREAPGTYHHSLIISNLAEQAAQRIGADALLVRVGAYYHDVGKTLNPQFYVENQFDGVNVHDALEPHASAAILHQHVLDGLNLTKRYGVSNRVRDLIPQHHGTTIATFFYDRALKRANGDSVDENDFRYPGPKPQTREAAIMMLADGVEATTRAERPGTGEEIRAIIDRIVDQRIREGQLDQVSLTLRDLDQIKQAFFDVLQGLYHPRVRYPPPPHLRARDEPPPPAKEGQDVG